VTDLKPPEIAALPVPTTAPQPKLRPVPKKVRQAIEHLVNGDCRTITAAAKKVGYERETLPRYFARVECREALRERAARAVAIGAGRAAARLNALLDSSSQRVALEAAKFSLGVAGIKPAADNVSVNIGLELKAGYVIDLSERGQPEMKIVGGVAKVIDAKPA
jgi:hypothetical protein